MQNRKIPVFYHIPKNAGTYVSDWMLIAFRYYRGKYTNWDQLGRLDNGTTIKALQIMKDGVIVARLLVGNPTYFCESYSKFSKKHSKTEWEINFEDITSELLDNVFVFSLIIESTGFRIQQEISNILKGHGIYKFLILRDPFYRAQSIYNYNTSEESANDYSHDSIKSKTFEDYVMSNQLEDSWLIRNLINLNDAESLQESHFQQAQEILKSFNVYDIKDTDIAIQQTFKECYEFDTRKIELKPWDIITKNETKHKKINIEELTEQAQDVFKQRTFLDQKLYEQFK
jgi:hypothetical protein